MNKRHAFLASKLETRAGDDGQKVIEGYFAVFEQETQLWEDTYERIARTAFDKALDKDIRCLFNHDTGAVLGRTASKTLKLWVDAHGLYGKVIINEADAAAKDVYARVQRGDISGCSFGFYPLAEHYESRDDGGTTWTVDEADLFEVSVCTFPAYPQTEIQARHADWEKNQSREREQKRKNLKSRLEGMKCLNN